MRKLGLIAMVLVIAGCASMGAEKVDQLKSGTRVTALSVMGPQLAIRHVGSTVFQNERRQADVPQWQIDRYAEAAAGRLIGAGGRFQFVAADTAEARKRTGKMETTFFSMGPQLEGGASSVVSFAKEAGADYVLVVGPNPAGDPFMGTNQSLAGYGVYQRTFFGSRRALNFLTMRVVLYDGRTGDEVARTQDHASSPRGDSQWLDSSTLALTDANSAATKTAIEQLIAIVIQKNLSKLKLVK